MPPRCLICESKAVLSKEAANAAVMLIGTIDNFLLGVRQAHTLGLEDDPQTRPESLLVQLLDLIGESVCLQCYLGLHRHDSLCQGRAEISVWPL